MVNFLNFSMWLLGLYGPTLCFKEKHYWADPICIIPKKKQKRKKKLRFSVPRMGLGCTDMGFFILTQSSVIRFTISVMATPNYDSETQCGCYEPPFKTRFATVLLWWPSKSLTPKSSVIIFR